MDELDRLEAVMKGSYLAKYFPNVWKDQVAKSTEESKQRAKELRDKVSEKLDKNKKDR